MNIQFQAAWLIKGNKDSLSEQGNNYKLPSAFIKSNFQSKRIFKCLIKCISDAMKNSFQYQWKDIKC